MVFNNIRRRLTLLYSAMLTVFLLAFGAATYWSMTWIVYSEEKEDILLYAKEEAAEHITTLKNYYQGLPVSRDDADDAPEEVIYYLFANGEPLTDPVLADTEPAFDPAVLDMIKAGTIKPNEPVHFPVSLPGDKKAILVMTAVPVDEGETRLGTLYVGRNITAHINMLTNLFTVLGLTSLVFLLFIISAGYFMAAKAMQPIQKSLTRQRQFTADASHELRTPLSVLLASVNTIERDHDNRLSPFTRQVITDLKDEIHKMTKIVSAMLTLARADTETVPLPRREFDLRPLAAHVVRSLQPLARIKNISITLVCPPRVPVNADRERLNQLLLILLDNSIKYTPAGGEISLTLEQAKPAPSQCRIIVKDTGIGIAPENQAAIFQRFFRVDKARARNMGGAGLGLSIAKEIVEAHGGTIYVTSRPGQGSVFTVILPA